MSDSQIEQAHADNTLRMLEVTRVCIVDANGQTQWAPIDGKTYRTADCKVLSSHLSWEGVKWWLLRMPDGTYIDQLQSVDPEGVGDHITIRTTEDAMAMFIGVRKKYAQWEKRHVPWAEAFPGEEAPRHFKPAT